MRNNLWVGSGISKMGEIPMLGMREKGLAGLIKSMFKSGAQGFAYDPNDLSTLYQDAAGTIPVTAAGQPVGLILDKSKGLVLGKELSTYSAGFSSLTGISSVGADLMLAGSSLVITAQAGTSRRAEIPISGLTIGKFYKIKFIARKSEAGNTQKFEQFTAFNKLFYLLNVLSTAATEYTFILEATAVSGVLRAYATSVESIGAQMIVESVSVKEIAGNHAYQTVSASRPVLQQTPILGSELVTNGDFSNGVTGWGLPSKATFIAKSGSAELKATDTPVSQVSQTIAGLAGKTVEVTCDYYNKTGAGAAILALWSGTTTTGSSIGTATTGKLKFNIALPTPHTGGLVLQINNGAIGDTVEFDNVSLKEVTGYRTDQNYLAFDGVDDYLIVAKDNLKFLHDGTGTTGFIGFKPSGTNVYHTLLNTGNLGNSTNVGYALAQDDRVGNGNILNMVSNGSGTLHVHKAVTTGISANPRVVSFKNKIGTHALRLNGTEVLNSSTETGSPSTAVSSNDLWIGRAPAGLSLSGNLYSLIIVGRLTTDNETKGIESEIAKNTGVTLSV